MELTQLRYFKTVAACENMSQAAEKLHISQPALSASVKRLEEELGVSLFDRTKNRIQLNDAGRLALTYADAVLDKAGEMTDVFARWLRKGNLLSLGFCDPGPMRYSVARFQKEYPDADVTSALLDDETGLESLLRSCKYDAIVSLRKPDGDDIAVVPFAREALMLSVPAGHFLAGRKSVRLRDEKPFDIIHYTGDGAYVRLVQPFMDWLKDTFSMKVYHDYFVFRQLLESTNAACFTTALVRNYRNDGADRVIVPLDDDGVRATYYLSYLKKNRARVAALLEWVGRNGRGE